MTLEEFAAHVARTQEVNDFPVERGGHIDGFAAACRDLGVEMRRDGERYTDFFLQGRLIGEMRRMLTDLTTDAAVTLCSNKATTLDCLKAKGVSIPESRYFPADTGHDAAYRYWEQADGREIVVKPSDSYGGDGITVGVPDAVAFERAWATARDSQTDPSGPILLEQRIEGLDVRAIVIDGKFICAVTRLQAHVMGDGQSSVAELATRKNAQRQRNPAHQLYPIRVHDQAEAIPEAGQIWFLTAKANIFQGGDAVDMTDILPDALRRLAEQAAQAVPGLGVAGVDMIVDLEAGTGKVIELNTSCNFGVHYYPFYGTPRNPARAVLDHMVSKARSGIVYQPRRPRGWRRYASGLQRRLDRLVGVIWKR